MRKLLVILLILCLILALILDQYIGPNLSSLAGLTELLKMFLTTSALVTALYALYIRDSRLRANSENVLVSLIVFCLSDMFLVTAIFILNISSSDISVRIARKPAVISVELFVIAFAVLFVSVFLRTYNQIYNLREDKIWKYFGPIRWFKNLFVPRKHYETRPEARTIGSDDFKPLRALIGGDVQILKDGGSILLSGFPLAWAEKLTADLVAERLTAGDTVSYVCANKHPLDVWRAIKEQKIEGSKKRNMVFIDAYTPQFAFTDDDIMKTNDEQLKSEGVHLVKAKGYAGLHTSMARAFNLIKSQDKKVGGAVRRPELNIYSHTSALALFESVEQFQIFWRHVIPSEKSYKMVTVLIESDKAGKAVLGVLKELCDIVLSGRWRLSDGKTETKIIREK